MLDFMLNPIAQLFALTIAFLAWAVPARFPKATGPVYTALTFVPLCLAVFFWGRSYERTGSMFDFHAFSALRMLDPHLLSGLFFLGLAGACYLLAYKFPRVVPNRTVPFTIAFIFLFFSFSDLGMLVKQLFGK